MFIRKMFNGQIVINNKLAKCIVKMKTKINKDSRNLLIALLLGDGTISNNYVFKLSHGYKQKEYLEWKIDLLKKHGLKNNGLKSYISTSGYNKGDLVYYTQLSIIPFIKLLRRVMYKPKKTLANTRILKRLTPLGLAIWFMDDGHINWSKRKDGSIKGFYIKISLCEPKKDVQVIIDYFKEIWDIKFYMFHEGRIKDSYSICASTKQAKKFIKIIEKYVNEIPSMQYKVQYDKRRLNPKHETEVNSSEDMV